jgi:hypothetical protein
MEGVLSWLTSVRAAGRFEASQYSVEEEKLTRG